MRPALDIPTGWYNNGGVSTRERIQDAAEALILRQGFAATSLDQILAEVGVTKGAFFHHFASKAELARTLIERYAERDAALLERTFARAEKLATDPLQQLLIFVGLLIEQTEQMTDASGCLFASYCYESGQFDDQIQAIVAKAMVAWRVAIVDKLEAASEKHPPRMAVDIEGLADLLTVILEGAYVFARVFDKPSMLAEQLRHYRAYLELLFDAGS